MKNNNFNLLRLFASLQVLLFHTIEHFNITNHGLSYFRKFPGVNIFFVVSGYLIYLSLERNKNNLKKYIFNRIGRIYPALWVSTLAVFLTFLISGYMKFKDILNMKSILYFIGQISFFQFWTPQLLREYGVGTPNGSLWTIVVEIQFYILLVILCYIINKNISWIMVAVLSIFSNIFIGKMDDDMILTKLLNVSIFPYLYLFVLGVILAKNKEKLKKYINGKVVIWFVIFNMYLYIFNTCPSYYFDFNSLIANILLGILSISFVFSGGVFSRYINKIDISYGIYLYHMIVINYFIEVYGVENSKDRTIICLLIILVLSLASYFFIEKPFLKKFQKLGEKNE